MLTKKQTEIIELFRKNIFLKKTIREIAGMLAGKTKAYPKTYEAVKELEKQQMLKITPVGNSRVCELNLSDKTISLLGFLDEQEAYSRNIPNLNKIMAFEELLEDIIIVTGSYAKEKQTKKSDIDLVVITRQDAFKKQKFVENNTSLLIPEFHVIVITYADFLGMLKDKEENLGKEVFRYRLIFKNSHRYYNLIKEAIKNGFRG